MYIRRVATRNKTTGESYFTHRLVRTERVAHRVRQVTLLNLGRHFAVDQQDWPSLCPRIEEILTGQAALLPLQPGLEKLAQRYATQLLLRQGQSLEPGRARRAVSARRTFVEVDVESLEVLRPRSVGVEHAGSLAVGLPAFLSLPVSRSSASASPDSASAAAGSAPRTKPRRALHPLG